MRNPELSTSSESEPNAGASAWDEVAALADQFHPKKPQSAEPTFHINLSSNSNLFRRSNDFSTPKPNQSPNQTAINQTPSQNPNQSFNQPSQPSGYRINLSGGPIYARPHSIKPASSKEIPDSQENQRPIETLNISEKSSPTESPNSFESPNPVETPSSAESPNLAENPSSAENSVKNPNPTESKNSIEQSESVAVQPSTPHEFFQTQRRNKAIAAQAAVSVIESQIKLTDQQIAKTKSALSSFKASHGPLGRRFGKSAKEFQQLQKHFQILNNHRKELETELTAAQERQQQSR